METKSPSFRRANRSAGLLIVLALGLSTLVAGAGSFEYDYVGGAPGYGGKLFLDASSSSTGTVADVLGGFVETPTLGISVFNPANARNIFFRNIEWNSSEITEMVLLWTDGALDSHAIATPVGATGAIENYSFNAALNEDDNMGHWRAASVPDAASTSLLFAAVLASLVGFKRFRQANS